MPPDEQKRLVAQAALTYVQEHQILGIGTGSTVNYFIDALAQARIPLEACVPSSKATAERLKGYRLPILELDQVPQVHCYIDGADECDGYRRLIKGGGGALTREKILACASEKFIAIIDASKRVPYLGKFPLPIEVIPMARSFVARQIVALGGLPVYREGFITDNGNYILDIHNLDISQPIALEETLNNITGIVENGLFAKKPADLVLMVGDDGLQHF